MENTVYAEFLADYVIVSGKTDNEENDSQPEILNENVLEENRSLCGYSADVLKYFH